MNKKENIADNILDLVVETCFKLPKKRKREKQGKTIGKDVKIAYEKLKEKDELSVTEMEVLKEIYQILRDDSIQSLANIVSILAVFVSVFALIVSIISMVKDSFAESCEMVINQMLLITLISLLVAFVIFIGFCYKKIQNINQENIRFRNNLVSSHILILERLTEENSNKN